MLTEYIQKALEKAQYKELDHGTWFAEIPGFEGVWGISAFWKYGRSANSLVIEWISRLPDTQRSFGDTEVEDF